MKYTHEAIFCIVNAGFSEAVMAAARDAGARGGTVIRARGTAAPDTEQKYQITVQPDKEIVMIITEKEKRDDILHALYIGVGLKTAGQGIAFSVPVDEVIGISADKLPEKKPEDKAGKTPDKETDKTEKKEK